MADNVPGLVERARTGDSRAFEDLARLHKDRIFNYLLRMVGDRSEAEDLAQEAFLRAFRAMHRFRGGAAFQTWLYRIASNLAVDALRRRKREEARSVSLQEPIGTPDGEVVRELPDALLSPQQRAEQAELQAEVQRAIASLSPKLREVVVMFDLQGLTYEELAQITGVPLGTVKSRLFNARSQLRDRLRAYVQQ